MSKRKKKKNHWKKKNSERCLIIAAQTSLIFELGLSNIPLAVTMSWGFFVGFYCLGQLKQLFCPDDFASKFFQAGEMKLWIPCELMEEWKKPKSKVSVIGSYAVYV